MSEVVCDVGALGRHVALVRMERGLSLSRLARAAGLSKGAVAGLESGAHGVPEVFTLLRLSVALTVSPASLLAVLLPDVRLDAPRGGLPDVAPTPLVVLSSLSTLPPPPEEP